MQVCLNHSCIPCADPELSESEDEEIVRKEKYGSCKLMCFLLSKKNKKGRKRRCEKKDEVKNYERVYIVFIMFVLSRF